MPHLFRSQSRISIYAPVVLSRCVYASQNFSCAITVLVKIPLGYAATSVRGFCSGARMIDTMVPAFQQPPALCNTSLCQSKLRHGIFCVLGTVYEKIFCLSTTFPSIHGCYKKEAILYLLPFTRCCRCNFFHSLLELWPRKPNLRSASEALQAEIHPRPHDFEGFPPAGMLFF